VRHNVSRGAKASIFLFDESLRTLQLNAVGADLSAHLAAGQLTAEQLDPAELSPGEFTARVRRAVEAGAEIIVIDGVNGYLSGMPDEQLLMLHLHELVAYLSGSNVTTFLLVNLPGALALDVDSGPDVSYLADTVILYRNYEHQGKVHHALSVLKHRGASVRARCESSR
jgi:circadian clock protein KaiC